MSQFCNVEHGNECGNVMVVMASMETEQKKKHSCKPILYNLIKEIIKRTNTLDLLSETLDILKHNRTRLINIAFFFSYILQNLS